MPEPFGPWTLLRRIAVGGMAEVFEATHARKRGRFAIKKILPQHAEDESFVDMLLDEARIAGQLVHANIVRIEECGQIDGVYFLAMEYVDGEPLSRVLVRLNRAGERLTRDESLYLVVRLLRALFHAHRKTDDEGRPLQIVHRDISPQNILITRGGEIKLVDFGVASAVDKLHKTATGVVKGKLAYMAPEQLRGGVIDGRVDQFASALLLVQCLTGERAYKSEDEAGESLVRRILSADLGDLGTRLRAAGHDDLKLLAFLQRALADDPEARFGTCAELAISLERLISQDLGEVATKLGTRVRIDEVDAHDEPMTAQLPARGEVPVVVQDGDWPPLTSPFGEAPLIDPSGSVRVFLTEPAGMIDQIVAGTRFTSEMADWLTGPATQAMFDRCRKSERYYFVHDWRLVHSYTSDARLKLLNWGRSLRNKIAGIDIVQPIEGGAIFKMALHGGTMTMTLLGIPCRVVDDANDSIREWGLKNCS